MAARDGNHAENQDVSRSANERLQDVVGRTVEDGRTVPFFCECADDACRGRVEISIDDYFIAHLDPRIDGEVIVHDHGHYEVVTKAAA